VKRKKAYLVINPRAGQNLAKLNDVMAVLSAAGWKTHVAIKEYGGHTMELATKGAKKGYDLVIGYGGDGTLSQVINGVLNAKGHQSVVGVIPGGTANVWAGEVGVPIDPVKASLSLVNSEARKIDVGHVQVASLTFFADAENLAEPPAPKETADGKTPPRVEKVLNNRVKPSSKTSRHFFLMTGLGIDAAVMEHASKPLKYEIGRLAVGVAAAKELASLHAFPVEIRLAGGGQDDKIDWKGEALQVVVGNTRRYGGVTEITPDAYIDDGVLDVCVITAGDPLTTLEQIFSFLVRRKPDKAGAEYFHGAHLSISVPASIGMQLDGSAFELKDYLSKSNWKAVQQAKDSARVMVNYRFDAMPLALPMAIPYTYDDSLFEEGPDEDKTRVTKQQRNEDKDVETQADVKADSNHKKSDSKDDKAEPQAASSPTQRSAGEQQQIDRQIAAVLEVGERVKVVGTCPNPEKKHVYIVAGAIAKKNTGEYKPVAVRVDSRTKITSHTGEPVPAAFVKTLKEAAEIMVQGKQNKRGVIKAKYVVVL
jgi:diacylglycerol kinase family enzyme